MKITFKYIGIVLSVILPLITLLSFINRMAGYGAAFMVEVFWFVFLLNPKLIKLWL